MRSSEKDIFFIPKGILENAYDLLETCGKEIYSCQDGG